MKYWGIIVSKENEIINIVDISLQTCTILQQSIFKRWEVGYETKLRIYTTEVRPRVTYAAETLSVITSEEEK